MRQLSTTVAARSFTSLASAWLLGLALSATAPLAARAESPRPGAAAEPVLDSLVSGGKRVRVERFEPAGSGRRPAVVLLHGLDGLEGDGKAYRLVARSLAQRGYVALLVHYFDRTGTQKKDLPSLLRRFRDHLGHPQHEARPCQALRGTFEAWMGAARDAVLHARKQPNVDPERVGLVGFSMGGFLATSVAAQADLRVRCVVELFGGLLRQLHAGLRHLPPSFLVHGDRDEVVPVGEALALDGLLRKRGLLCQCQVYKGVGHGFEKPEGGLCWLSALDARQQTLTFLDRHLGGKPATNPGTVARK